MGSKHSMTGKEQKRRLYTHMPSDKFLNVKKTNKTPRDSPNHPHFKEKYHTLDWEYHTCFSSPVLLELLYV